MAGVTKYYAKMFGAGLAMGAGLEVLLIKSNYCKFVYTSF
jgi:hypothetical protein